MFCTFSRILHGSLPSGGSFACSDVPKLQHGEHAACPIISRVVLTIKSGLERDQVSEWKGRPCCGMEREDKNHSDAKEGEHLPKKGRISA